MIYISIDKNDKSYPYRLSNGWGGVCYCDEEDLKKLSRGAGQTVAEALADLKETSPGVVYLDTAEYLLVSETATEEITALVPYVKKSARLCRWEGEDDLETAANYAHAHKIGTKICHWKTDDKLPNLTLQNSPK